MLRWLTTSVLTLTLALALGGAALAEPATPGTIPTSLFGGDYFAMSMDGTGIAFRMPDGRLRWELDGAPIPSYGVDDTAQAAVLGFDSPELLVFGGAIRGTFFAGSVDGTAMGFTMPDGAVRWELNGVPILTH